MINLVVAFLAYNGYPICVCDINVIHSPILVLFLPFFHTTILTIPLFSFIIAFIICHLDYIFLRYSSTVSSNYPLITLYWRYSMSFCPYLCIILQKKDKFNWMFTNSIYIIIITHNNTPQKKTCYLYLNGMNK